MTNTGAKVVDFSDRSAHEITPRLPLFASQTPGLGIQLEYHRQPPHELPEIVARQHLVVIHNQIQSPLQRERWLDGQRHPEHTRNGDVCIIPAQVAHRTYWDTEHDYLLAILDPHRLSHVAPEWSEPDRVSLTPLCQRNDSLLYQLGLSLKTELETQGWNNCLYLEAIANAFAMHVLRHYCTTGTQGQYTSGGLSQSQLKQVISYINELLDRDLSLAELAAVVQMSPNYFASLFKQATGVSPHQYVTQRRIESAKRLLKKTRLPLIEVAQQVGFANQSHFSTVFRKQTGMTPRTYRNAF
ncbi:MAG: helix-turn-helix domain-containing protein [Cyanophyceae cyanobacterium]